MTDQTEAIHEIWDLQAKHNVARMIHDALLETETRDLPQISIRVVTPFPFLEIAALLGELYGWSAGVIRIELAESKRLKLQPPKAILVDARRIGGRFNSRIIRLEPLNPDD